MEYPTHSKELQWMGWLGGIAVGALAMYLADPSEGRRRRALIRDQVNRASHKTSRLMGQTMRDARNRFSGLQAEAMRLLTPQDAKPIDDHVLEARVRSRLGRTLPHLHQLDIKADRGVVTVMGDFSDEELPVLLEQVQAIPGVEKVWHQSRSYLMRSVRAQNMFSMRNVLWTAGAFVAGWLVLHAFEDKDMREEDWAGYTDDAGQSVADNSQPVHATATAKQAERTTQAEASPVSSAGGSVLH